MKRDQRNTERKVLNLLCARKNVARYFLPPISWNMKQNFPKVVHKATTPQHRHLLPVIVKVAESEPVPTILVAEHL